MLAFKNNQLNSRNEKIDDKESSELRGTDFFFKNKYTSIFLRKYFLSFNISQRVYGYVWLLISIAGL